MTELWQVETSKYVPRISKAIDSLQPGKDRCASLPIPPFPKQLAGEEHVVYLLSAFARSALTVVDQLLDNIGLLWTEGRMVGVSCLVRFALEYWGAVHFGRKILLVYEQDHDLQEAARKTARLTFSGKTPVRLPWGGETPNVAYSVLTFIDVLTGDTPGVRDDYDFLSEASHPSFLQNTYFVMASKTYDNYRNEQFRTHTDALLERTISVLEKIGHGLSADVVDIIDLVLPKLPNL